MPSAAPPSGVIGLPANTKEAGQRVDFRTDQFDLAIETKGYRLAWSRATECPCAPINDQTEQTDPNCPVCEGSGWFYFEPSIPVDETLVGQLTETQQSIITDNKSVVIKGIMANFTRENDPYNKLGNWVDGMTMVTVRAPNKLGYYDRIINMDSTIVFSEILEAKDPSETLTLKSRYKIIGVNLLRSLNKVYIPEADFTVENGDIKWFTGLAPASGERLVAHYLTHPCWLVVSHPHAIRNTLVKQKNPTPTTPQGDPTELPIQAAIKYEFLPE